MNVTTTAMPDLACVAGIVRTHAARRPDATALITQQRTLSFGELHTRSSRVAQALRAVGVGFDDRVVFIGKNSAEFFEVAFGAAKLGAVGVPVNWRLTPVEMLQIIDDSGAGVIIVDAEFFDSVEQFADRLAAAHTIVAVGSHATWPDFEDWISAHPAGDPEITTRSDDVALQMYTSGTTGLPKGVMLTNRSLCGVAGGLAGQWGFGSDSVNLAVMPLFHMAGFGSTLVGLYAGCSTVVLRDVDPGAILAAIPRYAVTNTLLVPAVIQFLLLTPGIDDTDFSSLRTVVYGASPISDEVLTGALRRFGCEFIQIYGSTETTGCVSQLDAADHDPHHQAHLLRSCGKPLPWVDVRVVDADGHDVPAGEVGELWTRSELNMAGYWNQPSATAKAITADGWYRTGDAGYRDQDGYLYLYDRVKDMIVSGGENVYPAEVENVLMSHPAVGDVAVIGVPHAKWGEAVKAVVVPAEAVAEADHATLEAELLAYARTRLAGFKLPKSVDFAASMPRNATGKILKRTLREDYWVTSGRRIG